MKLVFRGYISPRFVESEALAPPCGPGTGPTPGTLSDGPRNPSPPPPPLMVANRYGNLSMPPIYKQPLLLRSPHTQKSSSMAGKDCSSQTRALSPITNNEAQPPVFSSATLRYTWHLAPSLYHSLPSIFSTPPPSRDPRAPASSRLPPDPAPLSVPFPPDPAPLPAPAQGRSYTDGDAWQYFFVKFCSQVGFSLIPRRIGNLCWKYSWMNLTRRLVSHLVPRNKYKPSFIVQQQSAVPLLDLSPIILSQKEGPALCFRSCVCLPVPLVPLYPETVAVAEKHVVSPTWSDRRHPTGCVPRPPGTLGFHSCGFPVGPCLRSTPATPTTWTPSTSSLFSASRSGLFSSDCGGGSE